jgi:bifunctional DNase/RNase
MQEASLTLYDLRGRVTLFQKLTQNQLQIDISELKQGVYLAKFVNEDQTYTCKFIKR